MKQSPVVKQVLTAMLLTVHKRIHSEQHSQSENSIDYKMLVEFYENVIETHYMFCISEKKWSKQFQRLWFCDSKQKYIPSSLWW